MVRVGCAASVWEWNKNGGGKLWAPCRESGQAITTGTYSYVLVRRIRADAPRLSAKAFLGGVPEFCALAIGRAAKIWKEKGLACVFDAMIMNYASGALGTYDVSSLFRYCQCMATARWQETHHGSRPCWMDTKVALNCVMTGS